MHTIFDHDEFQERREFLLNLYEEHNVPHIRTSVFNDLKETTPENSPIVELAGLFEFLVNVLIGDVLLGTDDNAIVLLGHLKNDLGNQLFLMGNLCKQGLDYNGRFSKEDLAERERKGRTEGKEEGREDNTDIPDSFTEALEQIQRHEENRRKGKPDES